jgi:hypothetical protein
VSQISAAWALFILRCTTGQGADFLFGQCTNSWLMENRRLLVGGRAEIIGSRAGGVRLDSRA